MSSIDKLDYGLDMPEQNRRTDWTTGYLCLNRIDKLDYGLAMSEQDRQTGLRVSYD
jgi:hypothetical protein